MSQQTCLCKDSLVIGDSVGASRHSEWIKQLCEHVLKNNYIITRYYS